MRPRRTWLIRLSLPVVCVLLLPAMSPSIGLRLAAWITPFHGHVLLAFVLFAACLFALNRVVMGLYQEFINRE